MDQNQSNLNKIIDLRRKASAEIINVDEPVIKLVIFELNKAWFAFPAENIKEILLPTDVFFVPGCPHSLKGVINVRGDIESVICLAELLSKPAKEKRASAAILLAQGAQMRSGLLVDRVVDVLDVVQSAIQPPLGTLAETMRHIVTGLIEHQEISIAILDLNRIFEDYARGLE